LLQPVDDDDAGEALDSYVLAWKHAGEPTIRPLGMRACAGSLMREDVFVLGKLGEVVRVSESSLAREDIDGPDAYGNITSARAIGGRLFACGIARQVYERTPEGAWLRVDQGVLDEASPVGVVTGFRDLGGLSAADIYAVGLDGEIWNRRNERWRQLVSPTNAILEQVRAAEDNTMYAIGQRGVILQGMGQRWRVLDQTATTDDLWGLEWFNGAAYVCSSNQLFRLTSKGEMLELHLPGESQNLLLSRLRAGFGTLWLFGATRFFFTTDGDSWVEAKIDARAQQG
jgi:hypothetical protein